MKKEEEDEDGKEKKNNEDRTKNMLFFILSSFFSLFFPYFFHHFLLCIACHLQDRTRQRETEKENFFFFFLWLPKPKVLLGLPRGQPLCSVMFNCEFDLITMKMCDLPSIILELYVCACFLFILAYNVTSSTVACAKNMEAKRIYHIKVKQLWLT